MENDPVHHLAQLVIDELKREGHPGHENGQQLRQHVEDSINRNAVKAGFKPGMWPNDVYAEVMKWYVSHPPEFVHAGGSGMSADDENALAQLIPLTQLVTRK